jgi:hypothetical protein
LRYETANLLAGDTFMPNAGEWAEGAMSDHPIDSRSAHAERLKSTEIAINQANYMGRSTFPTASKWRIRGRFLAYEWRISGVHVMHERLMLRGGVSLLVRMN